MKKKKVCKDTTDYMKKKVTCCSSSAMLVAGLLSRIADGLQQTSIVEYKSIKKISILTFYFERFPILGPKQR